MADRRMWELKQMREDVAEVWPSRRGRGTVGARDIAMQCTGIWLGFWVGLCAGAAVPILVAIFT